jgi:hypothetical protein
LLKEQAVNYLPLVSVASRLAGRANRMGHRADAVPRLASASALAERSSDALLAAIVELKRTGSSQAAIDDVIAAAVKAPPVPEPLSFRDEQFLSLP